MPVSSVKNTSFPSNDKWSSYASYKMQGIGTPANEDNASFAALFRADQARIGHTYDIICKWEPLRDQVLAQWPRLTKQEVDEAGPNRGYLAMLVSVKYGIDARIIKNYLSNLERNLPLL